MIVAVHAESDAITSRLAAKAIAEGRTSARDYLASRPAIAEWEAISRVKAKVRPNTWECFRLRRVEGWSLKETAEAVSMTPAAVATAVFRVSKLIAEEYQRVLHVRDQGP